MHSLVRVAVITVALLGCVAASPALAAPSAELPIPTLVGQATGQAPASSSSRVRIPRGAVKLAVAGVVLLLGAGGWVLRKVQGA